MDYKTKKNIFTRKFMDSRFNQYIISPFLEVVGKFSNRNAFYINEQYYTYKQFASCISKIRIALKKQNIDCQRIALEGNDDLETYASIFALWFEGKSYVPLNPNQPIERSMEVVEQINTSLILDSSTNSRYSSDIVLSTKLLNYENDCLDNPVEYSDNDLAYILFTSGSTGKPKGVSISRSNLSAFVDSYVHNSGYIITEHDRFLQYSNLTFDMSIASYLPALLYGACVYTVPNNVIKYSYVAELLEEKKITFAYMVPTLIKYLRPYFSELNFPSLRYNLFGGEGLALDLVEEWSECVPNATIVNNSGPTENTITDIRYVYNPKGINKTYNGILSIGKPVKNVKMIIVDESGNEIEEDGQLGELWISGKQLTPGYWNNDELNKKQFLVKEGIRWYKSGDLCFYDDDYVMISGRLNNYIKIQGYRVELGEVEFHAKQFLQNLNCIAIAFENEMSFSEIAMFIESNPFDKTDLLNFLRSRMPSYMIPSRIFFELVFPLNESGKVDRIKLRDIIK